MVKRETPIMQKEVDSNGENAVPRSGKNVAAQRQKTLATHPGLCYSISENAPAQITGALPPHAVPL